MDIQQVNEAINSAGISTESAKDFFALLKLRDTWKLEHGHSFASHAFSLIFLKHPTPEVCINFGIALFENNQFPEAAETLHGQILQSEEVLSNPDYGVLFSLYYSWATARFDTKKASEYLLDRIAKGDPSSDRLLDVLISDLFDSETQTHLREIAGRGKNVQLSPQAFRGLYEKLSASGKLTSLASIRSLVDKRGILESHQQAFAIIYGNYSDHKWREDVKSLMAKDALSPNDSYYVSLQAISRLSDEDALSIIDELAARGDQFFACDRVAATLLEKMDRRDDAVARHHTASKKEYATRGQHVTFAAIPAGDVKISCIALSYNDAPLVEHFCQSVMAHCDELIVNDGGSSDGTIVEFERIAIETGFPIRVIRDVQHGNQDRTIFNKEGYREKGLGGVLGFDADRRRSMTLMMAQHEYIMMADLDDYFPQFPNFKTLVAGSYGIEHFAGARLETLNRTQFTVLQLGSVQGCPTLFKKHPYHVYAGVSFDDEYLSRMDLPLSELAANHMPDFVTYAYNYWHLKFFLDSRNLPAIETVLGPKHSSVYRFDKPNFARIPVNTDNPNYLASENGVVSREAEQFEEMRKHLLAELPKVFAAAEKMAEKNPHLAQGMKQAAYLRAHKPNPFLL